jgi:hypothetical protein
MTLLAATLWLCTYLNNETPPRVFSVTHADQTWSQGEASDTCWRYCLKHGCECKFQDCKKWSPNGE